MQYLFLVFQPNLASFQHQNKPEYKQKKAYDALIASGYQPPEKKKRSDFKSDLDHAADEKHERERVSFVLIYFSAIRIGSCPSTLDSMNCFSMLDYL